MLASSGLAMPPCGVSRLLPLPPTTRRFPSPSRSFDRWPEPHLDEVQDLTSHDPPGNAAHQLGVRDRIEVLGQIGIDHIGVAWADEPVHVLDRIHRPTSRAIAIGAVLEVYL
jgi:hypothetical protein